MSSRFVIAILALALVGCPPDDDKAPSKSKPAPAATSPAAAIPATTGWQHADVTAAKLSLDMPAGAKLAPEQSGNDPAVGLYFTVVMPSGYSVRFQSARKPDTVASTKAFYKKNAAGSIALVVDADDAVVANRKEADPVGAYCEVTVCSAVRGKPVCVESEGALVDGTKVTKLTADECLAVVAISRSIKATQ